MIKVDGLPYLFLLFINYLGTFHISFLIGEYKLVRHTK